MVYPPIRVGPVLDSANEHIVEGSPPYQGGVRGGYAMAHQQPPPGPLLGKEGVIGPTCPGRTGRGLGGNLDFWDRLSAMLNRTLGLLELQELPALLSRLLVLSVLLAGCGGGGGAPPSSVASLHGTLVYALTECEE